MSDKGENTALFSKLDELAGQYEALSEEMNDVAVASNPARLVPLTKEHGKLRRIVEPYREYLQADRAIVTSDNPRSEDPEEIIRAVEEGLRSVPGFPYRAEPDRARAIETAILEADDEALVLVAGKGHEQDQELRERRIPFSDRDVAAEVLVRRSSHA